MASWAEYATPTVPLGNVVVEIVTPAWMAIARACGAVVIPALSFTVTEKEKGLPMAVVGVPADRSRGRHSTSDPATPNRRSPPSRHRAECRPDAVSWAEYPTPTVPLGKVAVEIVTPAWMAMASAAPAPVLPTRSLAVTVKRKRAAGGRWSEYHRSPPWWHSGQARRQRAAATAQPL